MFDMNPFDTPPSGDPLSFDPPSTPSDSGPGRGRMVLVAVLTAGLIGGGIAGISQLAAADRPELGVAAPDEPTDDTVPPVDDDEAEPEPDTPTDPAEPTGESDAQVVLDLGEGEPIVIDLSDVEGDIERLTECIGLPPFGAGDFQIGEFEPGELPNLDEFLEGLPFDLEAFEDLEGELFGEFGDFGTFEADDGSVTVVGPDGVSVVDLGENGSVTVTKADGEITVETDGDATVSDLDDLFGEFGSIFDGEFDGELGGLFDEQQIDEFLESLPQFDELPEFESIDPDQVQSCLDEVLDR